MEERHLFITAMDFTILSMAAVQADSVILQNKADIVNASTGDTRLFLVNGQSNPSTDITAKTWYRFRMGYASADQMMKLNISEGSVGSASCQLQLLAKDGVYLASIPRAINAVHLASGNRADVAVACTCAAYPCEAKMLAENWDGPAYSGVEMLTLNIS